MGSIYMYILIVYIGAIYIYIHRLIGHMGDMYIYIDGVYECYIPVY